MIESSPSSYQTLGAASKITGFPLTARYSRDTLYTQASLSHDLVILSPQSRLPVPQSVLTKGSIWSRECPIRSQKLQHKMLCPPHENLGLMRSLFSTLECRHLRPQFYLINSAVAHLLFIAELPL